MATFGMDSCDNKATTEIMKRISLHHPHTQKLSVQSNSETSEMEKNCNNNDIHSETKQQWMAASHTTRIKPAPEKYDHTCTVLGHHT